VRFLWIVSEVFLDDANDLDRGRSMGRASHPVPSRNIEQLPINQEAIRESFHPAQAGSIPLDSGSVFAPFAVYASFTVYAGADFQEVAAGSADIRLLRCALWTSAGRRAHKEDINQCSNYK
jgi:hypothetical protein